MPFYRKKPVIIEAVRIDPKDDFPYAKVMEFTASLGTLRRVELNGAGSPVGLYIETMEGEMRASFGDYVIKGVNGEFYPCKPDIFEKTYSLVSEEGK